jgi:hypothetical protein
LPHQAVADTGIHGPEVIRGQFGIDLPNPYLQRHTCRTPTSFTRLLAPD